MKGGAKITGQDLAASLPFLSETERQELSRYLEQVRHPAQAQVMAPGDASDFLGFVVSGRLAVKRETEFAGRFVLVALLAAGAVVGEVGAFTGQPRAATVVSLEASELLIIRKEPLAQLFSDNPDLAVKLLVKVVGVVGARLQQCSDRLAQLL
ncbi:MAG: cyclic nucleotide-binding domain-containing protein [Thermodesulfobacteriota bacterium]